MNEGKPIFGFGQCDAFLIIEAHESSLMCHLKKGHVGMHCMVGNEDNFDLKTRRNVGGKFVIMWDKEEKSA
jgi:hypothetical protein